MCSFFKVYFIYLKVLLNPKTTIEEIAKFSFLNSVNFSLNYNAFDDNLIGLKVLKNIFKTKKEVYKINNEFAQLAILDLNLGFCELDLNYHSKLGHKIKLFISKSSLPLFKLSVFEIILFFIFFSFPINIYIFFIKKHRTNLASSQVFFLSHLAIVKMMKEFNIQELHDHAQFEPDSNLLFIILQHLGIKHFKYPSPGPLKMHNQYLISNVLCINNPYQEEEIYLFKKTLKVDKFLKVPPEYTYNFFEEQLLNKEEQKNQIGYYSHGSWIRKNNNLIDDGLEIYDSEIRTLNLIKKLNIEKTCLVIHPKEKMYIQKSMEFYKSIFGESYFIINLKDTSHFLFNSINIGIGALSTILFERLFCGYKTLFYRSEKVSFPRKESNLFRISFSNQAELELLIKENKEISNVDFFKKYDLEGYAFWTFDQFKN